jgi:hypothetical protein
MLSERLSKRERLETVFAGGRPDRTPILGGWIACPRHICSLAGISEEQYWQSPVPWSVRAYRALGTDGLVDVFVPKAKGDFRCVDASDYKHAGSSMTLDEVTAAVDAMPSHGEIEARFDFPAEYAAYRQGLVERQALCGDVVWMPANWNAGARLTWYEDFGYENFFLLLGLHPERAGKLVAVGGALGWCQGRLVARAVEEGLFPHALLFGADICTQRGPMISTGFMHRYYATALAHGLEPLLRAGCRPVWHSDGDVRPMVDMLIACGIQGFQGFQPECGMTLEYLAEKRTREGGPLLVFGPLAVTTELPVLSAVEVRAKVRDAVGFCRGRMDLVLFTSNTINPDVPLENIRAMHEAAREG